MKIEIGYSSKRLERSVYVQIFGLLGLAVMFYPILFPERQEHPINGILLSVLILVLLTISLWSFFILLYTPTGVSIDTEAKIIEVRFWFIKSKLITIGDISNYRVTLLKARYYEYPGLIVHLNDGERIVFSDWNLIGYTPIQTFLDGCGITNLGNEDFNSFSYYAQYFKKK